MLLKHQQMIDKVLNYVKKDKRIIGLAIGGSYITKRMDEYSDLDFIITTTNKDYEDIMQDRFNIINNFGEVLSSFTGEHVNEPRLIICLYNNPLLHVDFKFVKIDDMQERIEDPIILYQENDCLTKAFKTKNAIFPTPDLQWIEDRFWVWIHYATTKLGRNELFEVIDFLSFLRQTVLGPLILMKNNKLPRGVRNIEKDAINDIEDLTKTIAIHDKDSCIKAIIASIDLYIILRDYHEIENFIKQNKAQNLTIQFFNEISEQ